MKPKRRDRQFLPASRGVNAMASLEPRRLLSATVGTVVNPPGPTTSLPAGRHLAALHDRQDRTIAENQDLSSRVHRIKTRPPRQPGSQAGRALAPAPIDGT